MFSYSLKSSHLELWKFHTLPNRHDIGMKQAETVINWLFKAKELIRKRCQKKKKSGIMSVSSNFSCLIT